MRFKSLRLVCFLFFLSATSFALFNICGEYSNFENKLKGYKPSAKSTPDSEPNLQKKQNPAVDSSYKAISKTLPYLWKIKKFKSNTLILTNGDSLPYLQDFELNVDVAKERKVCGRVLHKLFIVFEARVPDSVLSIRRSINEETWKKIDSLKTSSKSEYMNQMEKIKLLRMSIASLPDINTKEHSIYFINNLHPENTWNKWYFTDRIEFDRLPVYGRTYDHTMIFQVEEKEKSIKQKCANIIKRELNCDERLDSVHKNLSEQLPKGWLIKRNGTRKIDLILTDSLKASCFRFKHDLGPDKVIENFEDSTARKFYFTMTVDFKDRLSDSTLTAQDLYNKDLFEQAKKARRGTTKSNLNQKYYEEKQILSNRIRLPDFNCNEYSVYFSDNLIPGFAYIYSHQTKFPEPTPFDLDYSGLRMNMKEIMNKTLNK